MKILILTFYCTYFYFSTLIWTSGKHISVMLASLNLSLEAPHIQSSVDPMASLRTSWRYWTIGWRWRHPIHWHFQQTLICSAFTNRAETLKISTKSRYFLEKLTDLWELVLWKSLMQENQISGLWCDELSLWRAIGW
jgi:hypothetical protein